LSNPATHRFTNTFNVKSLNELTTLTRAGNPTLAVFIPCRKPRTDSGRVVAGSPGTFFPCSRTEYVPPKPPLKDSRPDSIRADAAWKTFIPVANGRNQSFLAIHMTTYGLLILAK